MATPTDASGTPPRAPAGTAARGDAEVGEFAGFGGAEVAAAVDGRAARSQRTREAVVGALLDLIREGDVRPTARRVAERASISLRSVYVHFDDLEDLFLAAAHRQGREIARHARELPAGGPFEERLAAYVAQHCPILEEAAPVYRAARIQEPFSPTLARVLEFVGRAGREQIERVFATELAVVDAPARRLLVAQLDAVCGPAGWDTLRRSNGLTVEEATATVAGAIRTLLAGTD